MVHILNTFLIYNTSKFWHHKLLSKSSASKVKVYNKIHSPPKVKVQPALLFSSFVHNSSINELKNIKLSEHICYEMIN